MLLLFPLVYEVAQYFEEIIAAILWRFIKITVSIHKPVVTDRWQWVVLQQFWERAGERRNLNQTQCNLLFYEKLKNFWWDAARVIGDRNGEKGEGAKVIQLHSTHFDFEYVFLPKIFLN